MAIDVLIAEDEPGILDALGFILKRNGWTIDAVTDGDSVLGAVRRLNPRMLVLDLMLPKRSGFEVLKDLRADAATASLPVLVLTAKGQALDKARAEELKADAFVTKPYANAEVLEAIGRLIEGRAERAR